ncbi:MAG: SixA phosphatase family protein [Actinomycetota bacterium]
MELLLVRHAIADERDPVRYPDDSLRPLTDHGRERFRRAARGLATLVDPPQRVLASPYARTWETATILADVAGWPEPEPCEPLAAHHGAETALAMAAALGAEGRIALVGHEPTMTLLARLRGAAPDRAGVEWFGTGAAALVDCAGPAAPGAGRLVWMHQPRALRARAAG